MYLGLLYATSAGIIDIGRCTWQCNDSSVHSLSVALNSYIYAQRSRSICMYIELGSVGLIVDKEANPWKKKGGQFESLGLWD